MRGVSSPAPTALQPETVSDPSLIGVVESQDKGSIQLARSICLRDDCLSASYQASPMFGMG